MRTCPHCGSEHEQTAAICAQCQQALPLPPEPTSAMAPAPQAPMQWPAAQAQDTRWKQRQYFLGLGLGLIPLGVFILALGFAVQSTGPNAGANTDRGITLIDASLVLYLLALVAMIPLLALRRVRVVGYGLLTALVASPVVGFIALFLVGSHTALFE